LKIRRAKKEFNVEAQLVAEAIAIYQSNIRRTIIPQKGSEEVNINERVKEFNEKTELTIDDSFPANIIYGIKVRGLIFTFYMIPITQSIINSLSACKSSVETTVVIKTNDLNFEYQSQRRTIILILDHFRKIAEELGI
jgi:ribosomal protein L11